MSPAQTPNRMGFRMPAEWEPHAATWLVWPQNREDWPGKFSAIQWVYADVVRHLHRHEMVSIVVGGEQAERRVRRVLVRAGVEDFSRLSFHPLETDRSWVRDSGPSFVKNDRQLGALCWRFNAWARYENWRRDARLGRGIARLAGCRRWEPSRRPGGRIVLEGGSIDVNGRGTVLTTEECLLGRPQERNPGMSRGEYERLFADYLGARHVLWLNRGIQGDDTHGHVDDLARFTGPRTVVVAVEPDAADENHEPLQENLRRLRRMCDQDGKRLNIVELPMPSKLFFDGHRLPASYANFYVANGLVLVPTFNDPKDRVALNVLARLFPDREVIGIYSGDLVWGFGTLHCGTQQQPAV